jgi:hypothetical protein
MSAPADRLHHAAHLLARAADPGGRHEHNRDRDIAQACAHALVDIAWSLRTLAAKKEPS